MTFLSHTLRILGTAAVLALPITAQAEGTSSAPAITVVPVAETTLRERIFASGVIAPVEEVAVAPLVEGQQIEELLVDLGDRVEQGAVIARLAQEALVLQRAQLEASQISSQAAIAQAEASLNDARSTADEAVRVSDRTETLRRDGTVSQAAADQAAAGATSALARLSVAEQGLAAAQAQAMLVAAQLADIELRIERTQIKAPVGGIISARNAQVGAIASAAGAPMFVIIRDGLLELRADVAERDVLRLAVGQTVSLRTVGLDDVLTGTVRLIDPTVEASTRLGRVRIELDEPQKVRSGLFAEAEILVQERMTMAIPVTAVATESTGQTKVLLVDEQGVVSEAIIETGIRDGGLVEVISGLTKDAVIVARAGAFVRPGDRISPIPAQAAEATN